MRRRASGCRWCRRPAGPVACRPGMAETLDRPARCVASVDAAALRDRGWSLPSPSPPWRYTGGAGNGQTRQGARARPFVGDVGRWCAATRAALRPRCDLGNSMISLNGASAPEVGGRRRLCSRRKQRRQNAGFDSSTLLWAAASIFLDGRASTKLALHGYARRERDAGRCSSPCREGPQPSCTADGLASRTGISACWNADPSPGFAPAPAQPPPTPAERG